MHVHDFDAIYKTTAPKATTAALATAAAPTKAKTVTKTKTKKKTISITKIRSGKDGIFAGFFGGWLWKLWKSS